MITADRIALRALGMLTAVTMVGLGAVAVAGAAVGRELWDGPLHTWVLTAAGGGGAGLIAWWRLEVARAEMREEMRANAHARDMTIATVTTAIQDEIIQVNRTLGRLDTTMRAVNQTLQSYVDDAPNRAKLAALVWETARESRADDPGAIIRSIVR